MVCRPFDSAKKIPVLSGFTWILPQCKMKPVSSGKSPFPGAVYELALGLQWIGLCISPATWTTTQDENGVAVHFQWQHQSSRGNSTQYGQAGQMAATHHPRPAKKQKPPSRQKRDRERWLRHQAQRKQASRQQKSGASKPAMEPPVTRAPAVQVASVKPPAVYGQQPSLNVEAPVFEPRSVFEADTRASPCETSQTNPISAEDRHEHQYIDNGKNAESDGDGNMTLHFVNCTTEELKYILCDQITVEHMKSKLAAAQDKVREYQCDIYGRFDLIAATSFTVHLDQKLPEVIEDLIHTKTKLQRTSNRLQSTPPEEPDGTVTTQLGIMPN